MRRRPTNSAFMTCTSASIAAIAATTPTRSRPPQQMRAARPQMLAALSETPGLDPKTVRKAANYLEGFFADIATDASTGGKILNRCLAG